MHDFSKLSDKDKEKIGNCIFAESKLILEII